MTIWTVLFSDNPLGKLHENACTTARVKVFNSRRTAYRFRDFCTVHGLHADVVHHPYPQRPSNSAIH